VFILTIFTINDYTNILFWVKIHLKTQQEIKDLSQGEGDSFASKEDDYYPRRLFDPMASGDFPSWTFSVQAMHETEAIEYR
jgi:catalase